jgi:hypothetical protein
VIFEPEDWNDVRILLDLAHDRKRDVATTTETPRLAVVIPDELYERFLRYKSLAASPKSRKKEKPS